MPKNITTTLARQLYSEFLKIKKEHAAQGSYISNAAARNIIMRLPAPRFYITPSSMYRIISSLQEGHPLRSKGRRAEMHRELWRRYQEQLSLLGNSALAIDAVINSPAPSYYLGYHQIKKLLYYAVTV